MDTDDPLLVAEDDANDALILERALREARATCPIHFCKDGVEVLACLRGESDHSGWKPSALPWLIITDLKMPRMDGMDLLRWRQEHTEYRLIPTIMLSASGEAPDIQEAYRLGVNSYFVKPSGYNKLVEAMRFVLGYWRLREKPRLMQLT